MQFFSLSLLNRKFWNSSRSLWFRPFLFFSAQTKTIQLDSTTSCWMGLLLQSFKFLLFFEEKIIGHEMIQIHSHIWRDTNHILTAFICIGDDINWLQILKTGQIISFSSAAFQLFRVIGNIKTFSASFFRLFYFLRGNTHLRVGQLMRFLCFRIRNWTTQLSSLWFCPIYFYFF